MFNVLILLSLGVAIGYAMRRVRFVKNAEKGVSVTVMLMLFTFGASIGADAGLMSNIAKYGVQALGLFTVSDHLQTKEACTAEERQTSFDDMIRIALETITAE